MSQLSDQTIQGHPEIELFDHVTGEVKQMITVCAECGKMRTIILLGVTGDRWYCSNCRAEGHNRNTKMFPIS